MKTSKHYRTFKQVFICAGAILGVSLALNTNKVQAAQEQTNNQLTNIQQNKRPDPTDLTSQQDSTKVVVHYDGNGEKWKPYIWLLKPSGSGDQYEWTGKNNNGYYLNLDLKGNIQEVGILIKDKNSWDKDGAGQDRKVKVDNNGKAEVWYKAGSDDEQTANYQTKAADVNLHYYGNKQAKQISYWTNTDLNKKTADLNNQETNFKISSEKDFNKIFVSPIGSDEITRSFTVLPGNKTNIYLTSGDSTAYYTKSFALTKDSISQAAMDTSNTLTIETGKAMTPKEAKEQLHIKDNEIKEVEALNPDQDGKSKNFKVTTQKDLSIFDNNQIGLGDNFKAIDSGNYIRSTEFDKKYYYDGDDLGVQYMDHKTQIKLWAPTAKSVDLNLYDSWKDDAKANRTVAMTRQDKGVWSAVLEDRDYKNWAYDFTLTFANGMVNQTNDPYSKEVTINGDRSVIDDYDAIKPAGFSRLPSFSKPTDAIIYETSIRDFTSDPNSGIKNRGKYLGMIESAKTTSGQVTGLDYLKSLGITHVQLMPMFDFASIDEKDPQNTYNWGYDPKNYNVPEGTFATDAEDPKVRIMEMKQMIDGLHKAGLRVNMDVVYNHVFDREKQALYKTVPGYYFQYDKDGHTTNGTGCGNDVASERKMVRKYIVDSVKYWAKNYNLDGFRFDLMGILDIDTMNEIRNELNKIDPSIMVYGEGWSMRQTNQDQAADQRHANLVNKSVGYFSDDIRNAIKGAEFGGLSKGLVEGNGQEKNYSEDAEKFVAGFLGGQGYRNFDPSHPYQAPEQTINYVACHDNRTLYDMLTALLPNESKENIVKRDKLATSMALLAQGVPFIHSGQESLRTKNGNENSYNSPIEENQINWNRVKDNEELVNYVKELINLRKSQAVFRQNDYPAINKSVKVIDDGKDGVFAFEYNNSGKKIYVVFNVKNQASQLKQVDLTQAKKLLDSEERTLLSSTTTLLPLSTLVVELSESKNPDNIISDDKVSQDDQIKQNSELDETPISGILTVVYTGKGKVRLTDQNGQYLSDIKTTFVANKVRYKIFAKKIINGEVYYRIGNQNQWICARYIQLEDQEKPMQAILQVVYKGKGRVKLVDAQGKYLSDKDSTFVEDGARYKVWAQKNIGKLRYYRIGNQNQWIPAHYAKIIK
ncbi:type I pullulanase [uncultured Lactobacillus sp.]|uniref:type I pullulanase n=1 Tax=uncultured Lactobacillus sp. TaxID=153152 RepID=UPI0026136901|nr:type I pullulanase [uncultured Lactobacillus sp.]